MKAFDEIARRAMLGKFRKDGGAGYTYYHCRRVMRLALALAGGDELRGREIDLKALSVAALFHDVGREIDNDRHCETGRDFVLRELATLLDADMLERVATLVLRHNDPVNLESEIIHDADLIDRCGATGIWRYFHLFAHRRESADEAARNYDEKKGEWLMKHAEWAIFQTAKREIERRLGLHESFMREFRRELDGRIDQNL